MEIGGSGQSLGAAEGQQRQCSEEVATVIGGGGDGSGWAVVTEFELMIFLSNCDLNLKGKTTVEQSITIVTNKGQSGKSTGMHPTQLKDTD